MSSVKKPYQKDESQISECLSSYKILIRSHTINIFVRRNFCREGPYKAEF